MRVLSYELAIQQRSRLRRTRDDADMLTEANRLGPTEKEGPAAKEKDVNYPSGVVQSKDSFYGQHDPDSMPVSYELNQKWDAWVRGGVLCSEMEASTLFVVGSYRKVRTGALLVVYGDQNRQEALSKEEYLESVNNATNIILEASLKIPT